MNPDNEIEPKEVFSSTNLEASIVKSLLENSEIEVFLLDGIMGTLFPWYTAPGGAGSVKLFVSSEDYDKAKEIVHLYERNNREKS